MRIGTALTMKIELAYSTVSASLGIKIRLIPTRPRTKLFLRCSPKMHKQTEDKRRNDVSKSYY